MAAAAQTKAVLEAYVRAWQDGDLEGLLGAYADDVVFHYFGTTDVAGAHVGKAAAVEAMVTVSTRAQRELLEVLDVLVGEELGALVVRERLRRGDEEAEVQRVALYRVEGEQIVECWIHDEDQALIDRFWRPEA
jgi:hypothetical protein